MKQVFLGIILSLIITLPITLTSSTDRATTNVDIITLTPTSVSQAKSQIDLFVSKGYRVKFIESQSVGTSVNSRSNTNNAFDASHRDIRGEFLIIMEKQR